MYKIKCFSDFTDSNTCKLNFEKACKVSKNKLYGKKYLFTNDEDYTHVIIINQAMPILNVPKENVIGLAFEPYNILKPSNLFIIYAKKCIGKYYIGNTKSLPDPFVEGFAFLWYSSPERPISFKNKCMSICFSTKSSALGHIYRHVLVSEILKQNLPVDIYGRGCKLYSGNQLKGEFEEYEPYSEYKFTICIENWMEPHYFSEKIITPMLCNCMPIYIGCFNINNYFPNKVINMAGNLEYDISLIKKILDSPDDYYRKTYKIQKKINLVKNIDTLFSKNILQS